MRTKLILLLLIPLFSIAQSTNGIQGYWRFNGDATDASGNGITGTGTSLTYTGTPSFSGGAASLNGTSSKVTWPYNSKIAFGSGQRTLSMLIKANITSIGSLYGNRTGSSTWWRTTIEVSAGGYISTESAYNYPANYTWTGGGSSANDGKWHHIIVLFTNTAIIQFQDGVMVWWSSWTPYNTDAVNATNMFGEWGGSNHFYKGIVDELMVGNVAWSYGACKDKYTYYKGMF